MNQARSEGRSPRRAWSHGTQTPSRAQNSLYSDATDPATRWIEATVRRYAKTETLMLASIDCL